jgi:hypothetical protein
LPIWEVWPLRFFSVSIPDRVLGFFWLEDCEPENPEFEVVVSIPD